jgi:hypothetical protein
MDDPMIWSRLGRIRNVALEGPRTQAGALAFFLSCRDFLLCCLIPREICASAISSPLGNTANQFPFTQVNPHSFLEFQSETASTVPVGTGFVAGEQFDEGNATFLDTLRGPVIPLRQLLQISNPSRWNSRR